MNKKWTQIWIKMKTKKNGYNMKNKNVQNGHRYIDY